MFEGNRTTRKGCWNLLNKLEMQRLNKHISIDD